MYNYKKHLITIISIFCCSFMQVSPNNKENIYGYTVVKNLRVRIKPSTKSNTVKLLKENEKFLILGFSDNKTTVSLRGKKITAHWYKIKSKNKTGWVFGGGVSLSPHAPKKYKTQITNSYYGYSVKTSKKAISLENDNFDIESGPPISFFFYKFESFDSKINYYIFSHHLYGESTDGPEYKTFVNRKNGYSIIIPIYYSISPDRKYIASANYYDSSELSILTIYKINKNNITKQYEKKVPHIAFGKPAWISNKKIKIEFIKDWKKKKIETLIYKVETKLIIPK